MSVSDIYRITQLDIAFADSTRATGAEFYANGMNQVPVKLSLAATDKSGAPLTFSQDELLAAFTIVDNITRKAIAKQPGDATSGAPLYYGTQGNIYTAVDYAGLSRTPSAQGSNIDSVIVYLSAKDVGSYASSISVAITVNDVVYSTADSNQNYGPDISLNLTARPAKHYQYLGGKDASSENRVPDAGGDFVFSHEDRMTIPSQTGSKASQDNYYVRLVGGNIAGVSDEGHNDQVLYGGYHYETKVPVTSYLPYRNFGSPFVNAFMWDPADEADRVTLYAVDRLEPPRTNNGQIFTPSVRREGATSFCLTRLQYQGSGSEYRWGQANALKLYDQWGNYGTVHFPMPQSADWGLQIVNGPWEDS